MGSIVMTGVEIGEFSIVAAGSLITQKKKFPPNSLIMGNPAQVVRPITEEEKERIILGAGAGYRRRAVEYSQDKGE
jgi:carbonic anhydrase/acetyltransferase-like protein (isoleucine patch superfamily)